MKLEVKLIILIVMLFLHIVDDYYLQGILCQLKQKDWWTNNAPDKQYKNDYKMALIEHAFSWSFVISIPILALIIVFQTGDVVMYFYFLIYNTIIHAYIDNLKANKKEINLITDQLTHILQIVVTWGSLAIPLGANICS